MVTLSGSTINYYPLHKTTTQPSSVYDPLQDKLTIIKRFFSEAHIDVTNNPEAYSLQEALKHALICSAEAENIGVPTTVIIDDFKGLFVEFTRSEPTHPQKSVAITLLSLKCPLVVITASIEDTLYSEKIINLLEEERQAIRKRYRTEVESMHYAALRALERKKTALTALRKDKSIEGWREYIRHELHHFDMEVRANNLVEFKRVYNLPNVYRYFFDFKVVDFNDFICKLMKSYDFGSRYEHHYDTQTYDVDQREFAVVPKGKALGTTNIRQCVAVVIKGNKSTALAHVDLHTLQQSLEKEIIAAFPDDDILQVRVYGPTDRVKKDEKPERLSRLQKIANENIRTVLESIKSLRCQGRNVNIASIQTNVSIEEKLLKQLEFENSLLPADWTDIITTGDNIYQNANPPTLNPSIALRKMIRFNSNDWKVFDKPERSSNLFRYNINNFTCIDDFIKDNPQHHFSLSAEDLTSIFLLMTDIMLEDVSEQDNYDKLANGLTPAYIAYLMTQKML